jgi:prepilin-type N-terminal cleavage/methylation domain-containing protein
MKKAFSLVELMIVVAVIGILAAMVIPKVQDYSAQAREATAKENLHILRAAIDLYASKHNGVPPGFPNNDPTRFPTGVQTTVHFINGRYMDKIPQNTFNGKTTIHCLNFNENFPTAADAYGYLYKPATKTIRLDHAGTDSKGLNYYDY